MITKAYLAQYIEDSIKRAHFSQPEYERAEVKVDFAPKHIDADYASSIAMVILAEFRKNKKESPKIEEIENSIFSAIGKAEHRLSVTPIRGFLNFLLNGRELLANLNRINQDPEQYGKSDLGQGKLALVEYFQLNVAKLPHIGHLRSAVIGDALKRILSFVGYKAVSDTHIGDWGTQLGIMLFKIKKLPESERKVVISNIEFSMRAYIEQAGMEEERDMGKAEFVKLERGDTENRNYWKGIVETASAMLKQYATRLGLLPFDYHLGESFYQDKIPAVLKKLEENNLLHTGESGERYIDLEQYGFGRLICIKSDGSTTYEVRDIATLAYRYEVLAEEEKAELTWNLYVVDSRQSHDFKQVFKTMELLGYDVSKSRHIDFGFMSLPEGAFSTRKGNIIALEKLIDEAEKRALEIIKEKNPSLGNKEQIARQVGLASIKYFDLKHNRKSDIVFNWDKALSFEGDAGPYLQYTHARFCSILRKAKVRREEVSDIEFQESLHPEGCTLLRKLYYFPDIVLDSAKEFMPSTLANYLFELCEAANSFYHHDPVLQEKNESTRKFRLALVSATTVVIKNGLGLLGIETPEEM